MLAREIPRERLKFSRIREDEEQIDGFARRNVAILHVIFVKFCRE